MSESVNLCSKMIRNGTKTPCFQSKCWLWNSNGINTTAVLSNLRAIGFHCFFEIDKHPDDVHRNARPELGTFLSNLWTWELLDFWALGVYDFEVVWDFGIYSFWTLRLREKGISKIMAFGTSALWDFCFGEFGHSQTSKLWFSKTFGLWDPGTLDRFAFWVWLLESWTSGLWTLRSLILGLWEFQRCWLWDFKSLRFLALGIFRVFANLGMLGFGIWELCDFGIWGPHQLSIQVSNFYLQLSTVNFKFSGSLIRKNRHRATKARNKLGWWPNHPNCFVQDRLWKSPWSIEWMLSWSIRKIN